MKCLIFPVRKWWPTVADLADSSGLHFDDLFLSAVSCTTRITFTKLPACALYVPINEHNKN